MVSEDSCLPMARNRYEISFALHPKQYRDSSTPTYIEWCLQRYDSKNRMVLTRDRPHHDIKLQLLRLKDDKLDGIFILESDKLTGDISLPHGGFQYAIAVEGRVGVDGYLPPRFRMDYYPVSAPSQDSFPI